MSKVLVGSIVSLVLFSLTNTAPAFAQASEEQFGSSTASQPANTGSSKAWNEVIQKAESSDNSDTLKDVELWLVTKWSNHGVSTDANPVLGGESCKLPETVTKEMVRKMSSSDDVSQRVTHWRQWYEKIFAVVQKAVKSETPGSDVRVSLEITVTNDKKISPVINFAESHKDSKSGPAYAQKIVKALSGLDGKAILAFPSESPRKQIKFRIDTGGFDNLELKSIGNPL